MIKITFKNVGQGDSIIIEWEDDEGLPRIGIVDCNTYERRNPVLEYIIGLAPKIIDFVILSHPHTDHFSGLLNFFKFCKKNNIIINRFLHTCQQNPDYLKSAVRGMEAKKAIDDLFQYSHSLNDTIIMDEGYIQKDYSPIHLKNNIYLEFLSPSYKEFTEYTKRAYLKGDILDFGKNNSDANLLSTIIKIGNQDNFILLTADADTEAFERIIRKEYNRLRGQLLMTQIPHHGSEKNICNAFWKSIVIVKKSPAVISVGENTYGHPSSKTIEAFQRLDTSICSTNNFNNFTSQDVLDDQDLLGWLDSDDSEDIELDENDILQGDKVFVLQSDCLIHSYSI